MPGAAESQLRALAAFGLVLLLSRASGAGGGNAQVILAGIAGSLWAHYVLVISDEVLAGLGTLDPLVAALEARDVVVSLYTGVRPDPTFEVVEDGLAACRRARAAGTFSLRRTLIDDGLHQ